MTAQASHDDILDKLADLADSVERLNARIGHEHDDGKTGSGLTGRIIRMESRVTGYDRIKERLIGGLAAAALTGTAIWWLVKGKVGALFGVGG